MSSVQRYKYRHGCLFGQNDGEFVQYTDHASVVSALAAERDALRARLAALEAFAHRVEAWGYDIQGDCVAQAQADAKAALEVR